MRPCSSARAAIRRHPPIPPARTTSRLDHVDAPAHDEVARLAARRAPSRRRRAAATSAARSARVAVGVIGAQRLLEPVDRERLELAGALRRRGDVPARRQVAGHPPALVGVDHDPHVGPDRVAHRRDHLDVVAPVIVVEAQLDGAHAARRAAPRTGPRARAPAAAPHRGVGEERLAAPAEQLPQGHAERTADEVPDRDLERPGPAAVEVDGLAELAHDLGAERVEPRQQPLEQDGVGQRVAAGIPATPSSLETSTSVASWWVRGCGSQAARSGGSSGNRYVRVSTAVILTAASSGASSRTARRAPPARSSSKPCSICSSGSRCEMSRSSGSRPRRYASRISGKSRSGREEP